jgi:hypothetical protein
MSVTLDAILDAYESKQSTEQIQDIPREMTQEEWELLNDHVNNGNLQAIYDYNELKEKLDKEWVDEMMLSQYDVVAGRYL